MNAQHEKQIALMKFLSGVARKLGVAEDVYIVGGAVRDFVLGQPIKDLDVVIDPTNTGRDSAWFAEQLDRQIPVDTSYVTNNYGVAIITVKGEWILDGHDLSGEVIEIANTRKESYGGESGKGYKPSEVTSADIVEDTIRREFNFNTLLWRLSDVAKGPDRDAILDLTGCGISDLKEGVLRCPSDPDKTFSDDPTRMIRVIKFLLRYKMKPTPDTIAAIKANAKKLRNIPYEAVAKLLVGDCFKEPTYAKALDYMAEYGLLDVIKGMMEDNRDFRTYMQRWALTKPVAMMLDLMDIGLPLQANVNFLTEEQIFTLREVTLEMSKTDSLEFLAGLKQPSSVWKDKTFFERLCLDNGIETKAIPAFSRKVNDIARSALLENPKLFHNPDFYRRAIISRLKDPMTRLATSWNPKKVDLIQVVLDDPDAAVAWFRKNVSDTLPNLFGHHVTLWYKPPMDLIEETSYGKSVTVKVTGYINEPDVQGLAVTVRPSGLPISPGKFLHITVATNTGVPPSKMKDFADRVVPVRNGALFTGKLGFKMKGSNFIERPKIDDSTRLASTWDPTKVSAIKVAVDGESLCAWFRRCVGPTLPEIPPPYITLWNQPPMNIVTGAAYGSPVTVRILGYLNEPDIQALSLYVTSQEINIPTAPDQYLHFVVATAPGVDPSKAHDLRDRFNRLRTLHQVEGVLCYQMGEGHYSRGKTASILPLTTPEYNLREIAKQMLLLEDHLFQPRKRCADCIHKHLLTIEALSEEMVTLSEEDSDYPDYGYVLAEFARKLQTLLELADETVQFAAICLRKVRKQVVNYLREQEVVVTKQATKSLSQREDESARDLVKKSPKLKPPRKDSRKERVDSEDVDIKSFKEEKYQSTTKNHKFV